jgi:hypothetical protein
VPFRRATRPAAVALALVVAAPSAGALAVPTAKKPPPTIFKSKLLWATVNVCDTVDQPNSVGFRASIPGSGIKQEQMYVRFQVQYFSASDRRWHNIGAAGDSGFLPVGSGKYKARQTGRTFKLAAPKAGQVYIVRGAATYEWRREGEVIRRARKRTTAGHPNTRGSDPAGFTAAQCEIR